MLDLAAKALLILAFLFVVAIAVCRALLGDWFGFAATILLFLIGVVLYVEAETHLS